MRGRRPEGAARARTFEGALDSFFANECPQLGGVRTRQVLVQLIQGLVHQFHPETHHLRQGQIQWTAVHKLEKASYGKRITQSRLTPVVLDLVQSKDALDRAGGKRLREIKQDAVVRLFQQAYQQDGVLTNSDLAVLLKISPSTVSHYAREWEKANQTVQKPPPTPCFWARGRRGPSAGCDGRVPAFSD